MQSYKELIKRLPIIVETSHQFTCNVSFIITQTSKVDFTEFGNYRLYQQTLNELCLHKERTLRFLSLVLNPYANILPFWIKYENNT
jgi:glucose-6-phosphate-specific signal transduction histidine kinase